MPYMPWFPDPGTFIRYLDTSGGPAVVKYRKLVWRRDPFKYPRRFAAVAPGASGTAITFDELNPSDAKKHIYLAYLGVSPGFLFCLWHPYDVKNLKWDEDITDINEDLTAHITHEESPYEYPTKAIGIDHDRYPAVQPNQNISGLAKTPAVIWIASLYNVKEHKELTDEELSKLESGAIRSYPWDFGGTF